MLRAKKFAIQVNTRLGISSATKKGANALLSSLMNPTGKKSLAGLLAENKNFYVPYLLLFAAANLALLRYSKEQLFDLFNASHSSESDFFFRYITHLGDGLSFVALILILLFVKYRYALAAAVSYAISSLLAQGLKRIFFAGEPRPAKFFEGIRHIQTVDGVDLHFFNSFPSGHSTTAFAICCLLALLLPGKKWAFLFILPATLAAISRVYLGQHFFADITTGSFIGVFSSTLAFYLSGRLNKPWADQSAGAGRKAE